jgi:hypothetical protein
MAKFYGAIGYGETSEKSPGVWVEETITERSYTGDVLKNSRRWQAGESLNDNLTINNQISIVADPFAYQNFCTMKYIKWMGTLWKITQVDVQRPRLILTIGGVYNGESVATSSTP